MIRFLSQGRRWSLQPLLFLMTSFVLLLPTPRTRAELPTEAPAQDTENAKYARAKEGALKALNRYLTAGGEDLGRFIKQTVDFPPPGAILLYDRLNEPQKFYVLIQAAEYGGGRESAEAVLARLAAALARQYEPAKGDPDLRPWLRAEFAQGVAAPQETPKIRFRLPAPLVVPDLPPAQGRQVHALAAFVEAAPNGGPCEFLKRKFHISDEDAARLLVAVPSFEKALQYKLAGFSVNDRTAWIAAAAREVGSDCEAVRCHPELVVFFIPSRGTTPPLTRGVQPPKLATGPGMPPPVVSPLSHPERNRPVATQASGLGSGIKPAERLGPEASRVQSGVRSVEQFGPHIKSAEKTWLKSQGISPVIKTLKNVNSETQGTWAGKWWIGGIGGGILAALGTLFRKKEE